MSDNNTAYENALRTLYEWRQVGSLPGYWRCNVGSVVAVIFVQGINSLYTQDAYTLDVRVGKTPLLELHDMLSLDVTKMFGNLVISDIVTRHFTLELEEATSKEGFAPVENADQHFKRIHDRLDYIQDKVLGRLHDRLAMWERQNEITMQEQYDINERINAVSIRANNIDNRVEAVESEVQERHAVMTEFTTKTNGAIDSLWSLMNELKAMGYPRMSLTQTADWRALIERIRVLEGNFNKWRGWINTPSSLQETARQAECKAVEAIDKAVQGQNVAVAAMEQSTKALEQAQDARMGVGNVSDAHNRLVDRVAAMEAFLRFGTLVAGDDHD